MPIAAITIDQTVNSIFNGTLTSSSYYLKKPPLSQFTWNLHMNETFAHFVCFWRYRSQSQYIGKHSIGLPFLANVSSRSRLLYVIVRPSVVCLLAVTFVHPTQAIKIFGNVSTPCSTLAIHDLCIKIWRRSSQGNPFVGGVKPKRGSQI